MQIYLSCSKTMSQEPLVTGLPTHAPLFLDEAQSIARQMESYSTSELQHILRVKAPIARQTRQRFLQFHNSSGQAPAIALYDGTSFKALDVRTMTADDLEYAQNHLTIGSFLYGLLRPLDAIHPYRMEGYVELPDTDAKNMFDYWRPLLTRTLIDRVNADDGVLINLASSELTKILDWRAVVKNVRTVITPQFKIVYATKPVTVAMYAKMLRGAMTRWIIDNRIADPEALKTFTYKGFSHTSDWTFLLNP